MTDIRYHEFEDELRRSIEAAQGTLAIAVRIDGGVRDDNVVIRSESQPRQNWCVQAANTRNVVRMIARVLDNNPLPDEIHRVYEWAINVTRRGWVVLTVHNGQPVRARRVDTV